MPPWVAKKGANTRDSTAMSFIRMLSDGPEVSFSGSPIVSPITAALCGSDPFGPRVLACSEAPAWQIFKFNLISESYILINTKILPLEQRLCLPQCISWHYPKHHQCWMQKLLSVKKQFHGRKMQIKKKTFAKPQMSPSFMWRHFLLLRLFIDKKNFNQ